MLVEAANPRQIRGDKPRRVFFSRNLHLIVWYQSADLAEIYGFQLDFGDFTLDHSLTSWGGGPVSFYQIDEGRRLDASMLKQDGIWDPGTFWLRYGEELETLPDRVREHLLRHLRAPS